MPLRVACLYASDVASWTCDTLDGRAPGRVVVERGRVVGAGGVARRRGVTVGMAAERARALLPEGARVVRRQRPREEAAWEALCVRVNRQTPRLEAPHPGLLYLEPPDGVDLRHLAVRLDLRGGRAPDRATALLAALRAAPRHALAVAAADRPAFLARYPTRRLAALGFEPEMLERLALFGLNRLGAAARLSRRHLVAQFGSEGARLHALLHPEAEPRVARYEPPPTVGATCDVETWLDDLPPARALVEEAARRATAALDGRRTRRLTLTLTMREGAVLAQHRALREPSADVARLVRLAVRLLDEGAAETAFARAGGPVALTALRVELAGLCRPEARQGTLFARRPGVEAAVRAVQARFPGALLAARLYPHALFPEERAALVPLEREA